mgnify:CR=1 FL=1
MVWEWGRKKSGRENVELGRLGQDMLRSVWAGDWADEVCVCILRYVILERVSGVNVKVDFV